jgi:hypothetical protein
MCVLENVYVCTRLSELECQSVSTVSECNE